MWLLLGVLTAFFEATKSIVIKHSSKSINSIVLSWGLTVCSLLILLPPFLWQPFPQITPSFWLVFLIQIILYGISLLLYMESLRLTDLSLALPMLAFSPVIILFFGLLINHEFPRPLGILGVGLVILGTYLLHFKKKNKKFLEPFLELRHDKGVLMMFGVSCIWGLSSVLDKFAILHSTPFFYAGLETIVLTVLLTPVAFFANKKDFHASLKLPLLPLILIIGLLDGAVTVTQTLGQTLTLTVFIISLKRTSIIFSSLLAYVFFKEDIKERILPISFMVAGVIMIALS